MARTVDRSQLSYLEAGSSPVNGAVHTLSAWYRPSSLANGTVLGLGKSTNGTGDHYIALGMDGTGRAFLEVNGGGGSSDSFGPTLTSGVWSHLSGTSSSATNHLVYKDGVAGTVETTSWTPAGMDRIDIGALWLTPASAGLTSYAGGDVAECAVWNVALTAVEHAMLAAGLCPLIVRPSALVFYAPLRLGETAAASEQELIGARTLAPFNTFGINPAVAAHPRIIYPSGARHGFRLATAGGTITPAGIPSGEALGAAIVAPGAVSVTPAGIASAETLGAPVVQPGAVAAAPAGLASGEAFGTAILAPGGVTAAPAGMASAGALGTTTMAVGAVSAQPSGIASAESLGAAVVSAGGATIALTGIASAGTFGAHTVTAGAVATSPTGITSAGAFGATIITLAQQATPAGIASTETLGTHTVQAGATSLSPAGITSAGVMGAVTIARGAVQAAPAGIATAAAFGATIVQVAAVQITPAGVASAAALGTPGVFRTHLTYIPDLPIGGRLSSPRADGALWDPAATLTLTDPGATGDLDPRPIGGKLDG